MRAVAAIMVLIGHVIAETEHYSGVAIGADLIPWTRGVDLFFVISGFIIALSGRRYFGVNGGTKAFLLRRLIRVVPLYYLFTTLMLATLVLMPDSVKETAFDPGQVLSSYAFLPYARYDGRIAPILSLGWTLNYEIFFYLLFSVFLTLRGPRGLILVVLTIGILGLIGLIFTPQAPALAFWTNPILIEFAFGILLAAFWLAGRDRVKPGFLTGCAVLAFGLGLLILLDHINGLPRFVASGIPALIMVAGPLFYWSGPVASSLPHWSLVLGDSSYALYLSHRFVLRPGTLFVLPALPQTLAGSSLFVVAACLVATGVAVLVFRHIETPMLQYLNQKVQAGRPLAGVA